MAKLILYRAMSAVPLLVVASMLIFLLVFLVPGNPVTAILGDAATPEAIAQTEHRLGLDQPLPTQYVRWVAGMVTGDMGTSVKDGTNVFEIVRDRFPVTFALAIFSMLCSLIIGMPLGIAASLRPGSFVDRSITVMTSFGLAIPSFWLALLLLLLFSVKLGWLPIASYTPFSVDPREWFVSLIMPSLAVGLTAGAVIARQTRSAMLEALEAPYMQTVRALGLRRRTAVLRYALKNAMVPVLTVIGFQMGHALGGSIIMEWIFAIPGVGAQLILSVIDKDFPIVRAITMMTALVMVIVYLLVDIGYGLIDAPGAAAMSAPSADTAAPAIAGAATTPGETPRASGTRMWKTVVRQPIMVAGLVYVALLFIAAIFAPWLAPYPPDQQDITSLLQVPSAAHWLGTDEVGRDVFSRVIFGSRVALQASLQAVGLALLVGVPIGLVVGFAGGWADRIAMRLTDVVQALPGLVVAFSVIAVLGRGLTQAMIAVSLLFATNLIRITRGVVLVERERLYVDAGRVLGLPTVNLLFRQILPNIAAPITVQATIYLGTAQLIEASLSFLGLGLDPTEPSWGGMLSLAASYQSMQPALAYGPGIALTLSVLAFNILGDGLRDSLGTGRSVLRRARKVPTAPRISDAAASAPQQAAPADAVLAVDRIAVTFPAQEGAPLQILHEVSFALRPGEAVGLVGESGSGKTMTALSVMGLIPPGGVISDGSVRLAGRELVDLPEAELERLRGKEIAMIFQDPLVALSPVHTIRQQMIAPMQRHLNMSARQATARAAELLAMVGIVNARERLADYPHQFSGGMAQRVMIAMALSCEPRVLIADEPTTALDVTVQAQVLDLLTDLKERMGLAILISTHDLGVVADVCDRALVMYAGEVVETGVVAEMFARPRHPYTRALLNAMPRNEVRDGRLQMIKGQVPPPWNWPTGCRFHPRCDYAAAACVQAPVPIVAGVRCVRADELFLGDAA